MQLVLCFFHGLIIPECTRASQLYFEYKNMEVLRTLLHSFINLLIKTAKSEVLPLTWNIGDEARKSILFHKIWVWLIFDISYIGSNFFNLQIFLKNSKNSDFIFFFKVNAEIPHQKFLYNHLFNKHMLSDISLSELLKLCLCYTI